MADVPDKRTPDPVPQGTTGASEAPARKRGRPASSFRPADPRARERAAAAALAKMGAGPAASDGAGSSLPPESPATSPGPAPLFLRDPAEAAADVGSVAAALVFGVGVVRWRKGGPVPAPEAAEFWGNAAADLAAEFCQTSPRVVNAVALRIAGKAARLAFAVATGAVRRMAAADTIGAAIEAAERKQ